MNCNLRVEREHPAIFAGRFDISTCDVVIPRIGTSITEYGLAVVNQFEMLGVPVVNGSIAIDRARDKFKCLQLLAHHGLPVPRTLMARDQAHVRAFLKRINGPPVVLKVPRGTHGVGVMLADTLESVDSILETMWGMGQNVLVQEFIAEARGRDMRVLVVGEEVIAAMRRHASGTEFRANVHRGGAGRLAKPTPMARRLAIEATRVLGLAVAGVDLVETAKGPLVLEVNASPGFEELERATKVDVAAKIIEFATSIARRLRAAG